MTPLVRIVTDILSFATLAGGIAAIFLFIVLVTPVRKNGWGKRIADFLGQYAVLFSFIVSFVAVVSSLFYSEIAGFAPCVLCWWQRVFLYPQAVIFFAALVTKDRGVRKYALPLSGLGFLVALYHAYIQFNGTPLAFCPAGGANCQILYFVEYGYVTIPTMALTAFTLIILLMLFERKGSAVSL